MNETTQALTVRPMGEAFLPDMPAISAEVIEKALTIGDMSKMPPEVRVRYYLAVCQSAGLNPLTRPFTPMKDQSGQVILYANKDCAEQLRAKHRVSVRTLSREKEDGLYIVTVEGRLPNGRSEEAQGIVEISSLKGQALANAMMKANTKAVRRVTLALCGLGFPLADEGDGHPVAMNWQTGEMREPMRPIPRMDTMTLTQHIEDASADDGTAALRAEIDAILTAQGVTDDRRAAYWMKHTSYASPGYYAQLKEKLETEAARRTQRETPQDAPGATNAPTDDAQAVDTTTGELVEDTEPSLWDKEEAAAQTTEQF